MPGPAAGRYWWDGSSLFSAQHPQLDLVGLLDLHFSLTPLPDEGKAETKLFETQRLQAIDYTASVVRTEDLDGTRYRIVADSFGEEIWLGPDDKIRRISIPGGKLRIDLEETPWPEWNVAGPAAASPRPDPVEGVRHVDVTIPGGDVALAATLSLPEGAEGPLPVVVFISGSGPQDRRARPGGIDLGTRQVLDRLARRLAVLHYDDRGTGESTGLYGEADLDRLVSDATAAVAFARTRPEIDPKRVALLGHSEGGIIAPILASRDHELAAIALMAGTARPLDEVIEDQIRHVLKLQGTSDEQVAEALREQRAAMAKIEAGEDPGVPGVQGGSAEWLRDHVLHDPAATIVGVDCPILILNGSKDFQVSADRDARALAAALDAAGKTNYRLEILPDLDHLFKRIEGESTLESYSLPRPVDEGFIHLLEEWFGETLSK